MATSETLRTYKTCKIYTQTPKDIAQRNLQSSLNERQSYCVHRWENPCFAARHFFHAHQNSSRLLALLEI